MDYKFYPHLEEILGQEVTSLDKYDEQDEPADLDPGTGWIFLHICTSLKGAHPPVTGCFGCARLQE